MCKYVHLYFCIFNLCFVFVSSCVQRYTSSSSEYWAVLNDLPLKRNGGSKIFNIAGYRSLYSLPPLPTDCSSMRQLQRLKVFYLNHLDIFCVCVWIFRIMRVVRRVERSKAHSAFLQLLWSLCKWNTGTLTSCKWGNTNASADTLHVPMMTADAGDNDAHNLAQNRG